MIGGDGEATVIEQWARVSGRLRAEVGEAAYRSWLKPLTLAGSRNGKLRLAVPTRFMRDWVASNYAERLHALWSEEDSTISGIEVVVQPPSRPTPKPGAAAQASSAMIGAQRNGATAAAACTTTDPSRGPFARVGTPTDRKSFCVRVGSSESIGANNTDTRL